jgi:hypothetical protein
MPLDRSLNDPLTAAEMKEIILSRIQKALDANSLLANDITYPAFGFFFQATLTFPGPKKTLIWDRQGDTNSDLPAVPVAVDYQSPDSPNRAREENGLPLPVLVTTPTGVEKRRIPAPKRIEK